MKKYKVLLKEVEYYYLDVEANNATDAEYKAKEMIESGPVDYYTASTPFDEGFEVVFDGVEEIK